MREWLSKLRYKFAIFMQGRNGMDDLAKAESVVLWILLILTLFLSKVPTAALVCNVLFWAVLIHMYFRVFSKNLNKRYAENCWYTGLRYKFVVWKDKKKRERAQKGAYRFFNCPMCKQRVRVPKGRGKICITCPKCREEFVRRT